MLPKKALSSGWSRNPLSKLRGSKRGWCVFTGSGGMMPDRHLLDLNPTRRDGLHYMPVDRAGRRQLRWRCRFRWASRARMRFRQERSCNGGQCIVSQKLVQMPKKTHIA